MSTGAFFGMIALTIIAGFIITYIIVRLDEWWLRAKKPEVIFLVASQGLGEEHKQNKVVICDTLKSAKNAVDIFKDIGGNTTMTYDDITKHTFNNVFTLNIETRQQHDSRVAARKEKETS